METPLVQSLVLQEPPQEAVLAWQPGERLPREAFVVLVDWQANRTLEARVELDRAALVSLRSRVAARVAQNGKITKSVPGPLMCGVARWTRRALSILLGGARALDRRSLFNSLGRRTRGRPTAHR